MSNSIDPENLNIGSWIFWWYWELYAVLDLFLVFLVEKGIRYQ
jgi:hypothetical protein